MGLKFLRAFMFVLAAVGILGSTTHMSAAYAADRAALVGTWKGKLDSGAAVMIKIPEKGNPTYRFRGGAVQVNAASFSAKSVKMSVGQGRAMVSLTVNGDGTASYSYRFRADSASTTLTK